MNRTVKALRDYWTLAAVMTVVAFFLVAEHKAHVLGVLPNILFVAFMVLHFWMHGSMHKEHDGHVGDIHQADKDLRGEADESPPGPAGEHNGSYKQ